MHAAGSVWFLIPALGFIIFAILLAWALRGKRVDRHPVCRRCRFDLYRRPIGALHCPECGVNVTVLNAVRLGNRERRTAVALASLPPLFACIVWLGAIEWGRLRGVNWDRHKPIWWLVEEAKVSQDASSDAAFAELLRRVSTGGLDPNEEQYLVQSALDRQADHDRAWRPEWGDVIEALHTAGRLNPDQWEQYAFNGVDCGLTGEHPGYFRPYPPLKRKRVAARLGSNGLIPSDDRFTTGLLFPDQIEIDGRMEPLFVEEGRQWSKPNQRVWPLNEVEPELCPGAMSNRLRTWGHHTLRITLVLRPLRRSSIDAAWSPSPNLPVRTLDLTYDWTGDP